MRLHEIHLFFSLYFLVYIYAKNVYTLTRNDARNILFGEFHLTMIVKVRHALFTVIVTLPHKKDRKIFTQECKIKKEVIQRCTVVNISWLWTLLVRDGIFIYMFVNIIFNYVKSIK